MRPLSGTVVQLEILGLNANDTFQISSNLPENKAITPSSRIYFRSAPNWSHNLNLSWNGCTGFIYICISVQAVYFRATWGWYSWMPIFDYSQTSLTMVTHHSFFESNEIWWLYQSENSQSDVGSGYVNSTVTLFKHSNIGPETIKYEPTNHCLSRANTL